MCQISLWAVLHVAGHHASGVCRLDYQEGEPSPYQTRSLSTPSLCPGTPPSGFKAWLSSASSMKPAIPLHPKPVLSPPKPVTLCLTFPSSPIPPSPCKCNITFLAFQASGWSSKVTLSGTSGTTSCSNTSLIPLFIPRPTGLFIQERLLLKGLDNC